MKPMPERRLCLGCGEALRPLVVAASPQASVTVPARVRAMPKVVIRVLAKS